MKEHYNKVLRDSDARVARFMEIQILDRNDPFFGGFPSADSIAEPKVAIYHLTTMTACCLNADSKWHLDAEVLRRILLALGLCAPLPAAGRLFRPRQLQLFFRPGHGFLHEAAAARVRISVPDRGGCAGGGRGGKRCVRAAAAAV